MNPDKQHSNIPYHLADKVVNQRFELPNTSKVKEPVSEDFINHINYAFSGHNNVIHDKISEFPIGTILEYLKSSHRFYLEKKLPEMENLIEELIKNEESSLGLVLRTFFLSFSKELRLHIGYEEKYLFPYIEELIYGDDISEKFRSFKISNFIESHTDDVEESLQSFIEHLNTTFSDLGHLFEFKHFKSHLTSFEMDLRVHGVIEDHILIPKVLILELLNEE